MSKCPNNLKQKPLQNIHQQRAVHLERSCVFEKLQNSSPGHGQTHGVSRAMVPFHHSPHWKPQGGPVAGESWSMSDQLSWVPYILQEKEQKAEGCKQFKKKSRTIWRSLTLGALKFGQRSALLIVHRGQLLSTGDRRHRCWWWLRQIWEATFVQAQVSTPWYTM